MRSLLIDDRGQDLAEYGLCLAIVAIGAAAIALAVGADVFTLWDNAHDALHPAGAQH